MQHLHRCLCVVAITAGAVACSDPIAGPRHSSQPDLMSPTPPAPGRVIFLPPLGSGLPPNGASDVSHQVAVEICALRDSTCAGSAIARFGTSGTDSARLRVVGADTAAIIGHGFYAATWRIPSELADSGLDVRVRVVVDGAEHGHVDVHVLGSPDAAATVTPNVTLVSPGTELEIRFWIERPPRRFTVLVGAGVRGIPTASDSLWPYASKVPYAFSPAPGYEHVVARLDGMPAPPAGLVVTDTEHVLTVTADRHVVLSSAAQPLYSMARDVLTSAEPVGAYQAYSDAATAYIASPTRSPDEAMSDIRDVEFLAFDPIRDSAALRRVDAALAGHVFPADSSGASVAGSRAARIRHDLRTSGATTGADSTEHTVFLYVNGIGTPQFGPEGAVATRFELASTVSEVPLFRDSAVFHVHHFYNRTYSEQRPTPEQQRAHCVMQFASRLAFGYLGANTFASFMAECTADDSYRRFSDHDLLESIRQMWSIILNTDAAEVDAEALAARIEKMRTAGNHVILVPHSQGNLMANQAIHGLRSLTHEFDPARDSACIGLVSLASPTSHRWELGEHYIAPVVVRGDVVPTIDNDWDPIDTDLSHRLLDNPTIETAFSPTGIILHAVLGSYFGQPQSRAAIKSGLLDVYRACAVSSLAIHPPSLTLSVGGSATLVAAALNAFGDTLGGRSVAWASTVPSVVSATATGPMTATARGVGAGGGSAVASRGAKRAETAVLVTKPVVDPFSVAYIATYPEGFFGDDQHLSGTDAHPGAVPKPAGTLRLSFTSQFGRLSAAVNDQLYTVGMVGSDSIILGGNPGSTYRLGWNADKTTLSGTVDPLIWVFEVGFVRTLRSVTFDRETP